MIDIDGMLNEAAKQMQCHVSELEWFSWPETFSSTAGPHGGIGGQATTTYQVFAFSSANGRIKCCCGKWRKWRGEFMEGWYQ